MTSTDSTYLEAKQVKEGSQNLRTEFVVLKEFLRKEYSAILLNADIFQPVFKTMDPKLRLIIDSEIKNTNLPIYYLDRNKIRDKFLSIYKNSNSNLTKGIIDDKLSVDFVEFDELLYHETRSSAKYSEIINTIDETSILKMNNYFSEYIFFFENKKELEIHLKKNLQDVIKSKITELIIEEGYNGSHLSYIAVRFDKIDSFEKARSGYNYLR